MGQYLPIAYPPGLSRQGTIYQNKGRWYDSNLLRFFDGAIEPVGGWAHTLTTPVTGVARGMISWRDLSTVRWIGIGTNSNLYVSIGGAVGNITPTGFTAGRVDSIYGLGFGASLYGKQAYGTARSSTGLVLDAATWSFDTWGQNLVACSTSDGNLYQWVPSNSGDILSPTPAAIITNAPTQCRSTFVTEERYQVAIGAGGDPRNVTWCNQGDNTTWTAAVTNTAGSLEMTTNGIGMTGKRVRGGNLIWTDVDVHFMQYVGTPYIYGIQRLGTGCGLIGPNAAISIDGVAYWMSDRGFWTYNGYVQPMECSFQDDLFNNLNVLQGAKVYAGHNGRFGEIWWFYPSMAGTENDRYVIYNYRENTWNWGALSRTCWIDRGPLQYPMALDTTGQMYQHEYGVTADGALMNTWLQSAAIELGNGDNLMQVQKIIVDGDYGADSFTLSFNVANTPNGPSTTVGPYTPNLATGYTDARFTGRQAVMTITATNNDPAWRVGQFRLEVKPGSKR